MKTTRRDLLKLAAGGAGALLTAPGLLRAQQMFDKPPVGGVTPATSTSSGRVVIIGGGWGGLTVARALKQARPATSILVIEQNPIFMSCPMSNLYLGGVLPLEQLQFSYAALGRNGIGLAQERVTGIDRASGTVETTGGKFEYDLLVLAPGIDYMWDKVPGLWEGRFDIPIAFKPGAEHIHLKRTLDAFQGGTFVLAIPEAPYRCPPGPYERIAMIAYNFKKRGLKAKLLALDANPAPVSKAKGFLTAYEELYKGIVEYMPNHKVESVDHTKRSIKHAFGETTYDAANVIPPMQAAGVVRLAGIGERWADVNSADFSAKADPRVFVVGDAIGGQPFPKSGFMANTLGKVVSRHVAARLDGKDSSPLVPANVCYSMVDGDQGGKSIWVSNAFTWNAAEKKYENQMKVDLVPSLENAESGFKWANSVWTEMLG